MKKKLLPRFTERISLCIKKSGSALSLTLSFLLITGAVRSQCVTKIQGDTSICAGSTTTLTGNVFMPYNLMASNTAGNNHRGNMFDIVATNTVVIDSFEASPMGNTTIEVYYKTGTWNGFANTPSAWTLIGSAPVSYTGGFSPVAVPVNITIPAGSTVAFYITSNTSAVSLNYSNGTAVGNVYSSDANITFLEGGGLEYPFTQGTGAVYQPRVWNGRIHYSLPLPATYTWSTGASTQSIDVTPSSGTQYWVEASATGCGLMSDSLNVNPYTVSATATATDVVCHGGADGAIDLTASGGVAPYTFDWGAGITTEDLANLSAGTYTVTITDADGCMATENATVNEPDAIIVSVASQTNVSCNGGNDGSVTVSTTGGTGAYTYSWTPGGATSATASGLSAGNYTVTVTDISACEATENIGITEPAALSGTDFQLICEGNGYNFNGQLYTASNNTAMDTLTALNGCDSFVTLNLWVWDNGVSPTGGSYSGTQIDDVVTLTNANCQLLAKVESPTDLGIVSMDVDAASGAPIGVIDPYVNRYFDISTSQPGGGTVTLYFTQQEFDDYNNFVGIGNAIYPQIGANGENLQITAFHSVPGSDNGPGGYDPATAEVLPCTAIWNSMKNRWEVTFNTSSFSGFFLHTKADGTALPIKMGGINAVNLGAVNRVDWTTAEEIEGDIFEIESSSDGRNFSKISTINAGGVSGSKYSFVDTEPFNGINYYRLHLISADGSKSYSNTVSATVHLSSFIITAHPNPFKESLQVSIRGKIGNHAVISICDVAGKVIQRVNVSSNLVTLPLQSITPGTYFIRYQDDERREMLKVIKD